VTERELIESAQGLLNPYRTPGGRLFGDVASTLVTERGNRFSGVCLDLGGGFCAERCAIGAMVTAREYRIATIVAVWRHPDTAALYVLPPCGHCREVIRAVDPANLDTAVVLGIDHAVPLRELLPYHEWPQPL